MDLTPTLGQRIRGLGDRIRSIFSALYTNLAAAQWWRHPYVKVAAVTALGCLLLVVLPMAVALGQCKTPPVTLPEPQCGIMSPEHPLPWVLPVVNGETGLPKEPATLIRPDFVLVGRYTRAGDIVVFGDRDCLDCSAEIMMVSGYWGDFHYGRRLVKLSRPAHVSKYINPVCLPKRGISAGSNCFISCWGKGPVRIISNDQCKREVPSFLLREITNATFCIAANETYPLHMDWWKNGCPLMCEEGKGIFLHGELLYPGSSTQPAIYHNVTAMLPRMDKMFQL